LETPEQKIGFNIANIAVVTAGSSKHVAAKYLNLEQLSSVTWLSLSAPNDQILLRVVKPYVIKTIISTMLNRQDK